jgi:hypothetical protein
MVDLRKAVSFMAANGRVLDRRRLQVLLGDGDREALVAALDGYRNTDGGYGWGMEPDLRAAESQPAGALHAFEALADAAPVVSPHAVQLCDWLDSVTLPDGGLPFALPVTDPAGLAPFWADADPATSSLQITAYVAATAHRVARHDAAVAAHPWLARATRHCLDAIAALDEEPFSLVLVASLGFLDVVVDPGAVALIERLGRFLPADGVVRVAGGTEDEAVRPLDFAPYPEGPVRGLFAPDVIAADLRRLADGQREDGGWTVDFASYSPAAALEWRGYQTVRALTILRRNGVDVDTA